MKIYVASSWRNVDQPFYVKELRMLGHDVYDFRNPEKGDIGFAWGEIDENWKNWDEKEFIENLEHPACERGFNLDWGAMKDADVCVLINPCGKSAHLEAGYFVGANKPLIIMTDEGMEPELMYKMATSIIHNPMQLSSALEHVRVIIASEG